MSKKYDIEGLDILDHNGRLILVYDDGVSPRQKILVYAKSYRELNEKALTILGGEDWMNFLFYMDEEFPGDTIDHLMADMYARHNDTYTSMFKKWHSDWLDDEPDDMLGDYDDESDDCKDVCLTMKVVRTDENGHRWAVFDKKSVEGLDDDMLQALAEDMEIPNYDLKDRAELIDSICAEESDIDGDDCECIDDCDGDCDNCEFAELDEREEDEKDVAVQESLKQEVPKQDAPQYESVNGPAHYNGTECIENMRKLYGDEAVRWFCICSAYKYRFRKGNKPGAPAEIDEGKASWFENYAAEMMSEQRYY